MEKIDSIIKSPYPIDNTRNLWLDKDKLKVFYNGKWISIGGNGGSGGSGTTDYNDLENKPSINNVELSGNKTIEELGLQPYGDYIEESQFNELKDTVNRIEAIEYNLSKDGTKYTLATAVAKADTVIPEDNKVAGVKITFVNSDTSLPETYAFQGDTFTTADNWLPELRLENFLGLDGKPEKVELTVKESGKYWDLKGVKYNADTYSIYEKIELNPGDILFGISGSYNNISELTEVDSEGNNFLSAIIAGSASLRKIFYIANRNIFVQLSLYSPSVDNGKISIYILRNGANKGANFFIDLNPEGGYIKKIAESIGALYNTSTGLYEMDGINDLTEDDMINIIVESFRFLVADSNISYATLSHNSKARIRKILWQDASLFVIYNYRKTNPINGVGRFYNMKKLEKIIIPTSQNSYRIYFSGMNSFCGGCLVLKQIEGVFAVTSVIDDTSFKGCVKLETCKIYELSVNASFKDCSMLSNESILYMIQNSAAESPITITLHADAYARANEDPEIQAALQEKTNVSLASA